MSKKFKREIAEKDRLIAAFDGIAAQYPLGGYDQTVEQLRRERAEQASKIGQKKVR